MNFRKRFGPITVALTTRRYAGKRSWVFKLIWRKGAGYIGGRTFFASWRCHDMRGSVGNGVYHSYHTPRLLACGLTRNANIVPIPMNYC